MSESVKSEPVSYQDVAEQLQYLGDIPIDVTVQLGERRMKIGDLLRLHVGSVISLPKSAGENVDVLINGRITAFGEVTDLTGIRITELNISE